MLVPSEVSASPASKGNILASDAEAGDWFGCSVSVNGDYALVGTYREDAGDFDLIKDTGAAYIY